MARIEDDEKDPMFHGDPFRLIDKSTEPPFQGKVSMPDQLQSSPHTSEVTSLILEVCRLGYTVNFEMVYVMADPKQIVEITAYPKSQLERKVVWMVPVGDPCLFEKALTEMIAQIKEHDGG